MSDRHNDYLSAQRRLEDRIKLAKEAHALDMTIEAATLDAEAAKMRAELDAYPALDAEAIEAAEAFKGANRKRAAAEQAFNEGRARHSEMMDVISASMVAQQRMQKANTAASKSLGRVRNEIGRETDAAIERARTNIEALVIGCLDPERRTLGESIGARLTDRDGAAWEPLFAARAVAEYPKRAKVERVGRPLPLDDLRYAIVARASRLQGRPMPARETFVASEAR